MGHFFGYTEHKKGAIGMIYTCQTKCCHYIFPGSEQQRTCPDCGKPHIRPSSATERIEYFRRQTNALVQHRRSV